MHNPFTKAKQVVNVIEQHGHQAFFVGGSVRDQLLDVEIGDIDITTSAKPEQIQQIFEKVIPVGIEHGTVIVRYDGESYEVTTFRTEGKYSDFRHPDQVSFVDDIELDLARRDFTINAIAMDVEGNYVDPFHGKDDINNKCIRTVGNPAERFQEDPLRMLRALRFTSQLGFDISAETFSVLQKYVYQIEKVAIERIAVEVEKMFSGSSINHAIQLFINSNIHKHLPIFKENQDIVDQLQKLNKPLLSMEEVLVLCHYYNPSISIVKWAKEWKLSNQIKNNAIKLVAAINDYQQNNMTSLLIYRLPPHLDKGMVRLINVLFPEEILVIEQITKLRDELPIKNRKQMALTGEDIVTIFPNKRKGPWINDALTAIECAIVQNKIANRKTELERWLTDWNPPETN